LWQKAAEAGKLCGVAARFKRPDERMLVYVHEGTKEKAPAFHLPALFWSSDVAGK